MEWFLFEKRIVVVEITFDHVGQEDASLTLRIG
jgi:hypothetical protein